MVFEADFSALHRGLLHDVRHDLIFDLIDDLRVHLGHLLADHFFVRFIAMNDSIFVLIVDDFDGL